MLSTLEFQELEIVASALRESGIPPDLAFSIYREKAQLPTEFIPSFFKLPLPIVQLLVEPRLSKAASNPPVIPSPVAAWIEESGTFEARRKLAAQLSGTTGVVQIDRWKGKFLSKQLFEVLTEISESDVHSLRGPSVEEVSLLCADGEVHSLLDALSKLRVTHLYGGYDLEIFAAAKEHGLSFVASCRVSEEALGPVVLQSVVKELINLNSDRLLGWFAVVERSTSATCFYKAIAAARLSFAQHVSILIDSKALGPWTSTTATLFGAQR